MPTCKCGETVSDWRGARGHVKFTDGKVSGVDHGPKQEVPDDYRSLFDEDAEPETPDEPDDVDDDEDATDDEVRESTPDEKPDNEQSTANEQSTIKKILTTPINELLGGGKS